MKPFVTIIIPVRNEEKTIAATINSLRAVRIPTSIIVVSDVVSQNDITEDVVAAYIRAHTGVRLLSARNVQHHGFAAALKRGVLATKTPYCVFVMADRCDDPHTIDGMCSVAQRGADVVCGSRYMPGGKRIGGPFGQALFSRMINQWIFACTGIPTHDASNSYKLYKTSLLKRIHIDKRMGSEVSIDIALQAFWMRAAITELPTVWKGRTEGTSKFTLTHQCIGYGRICISVLQGRYNGRQR